jgi:hypothetical protein
MLLAVAAGLLAASTGCCLCQPWGFSCRQCANRGYCDSGFCGDQCEEGCGQACGPMRQPFRPLALAPRQAGVDGDCCDDSGCECARPCGRPFCGRCGPCTDPCGDSCGDCCCARPWYRGPLSCVFALFTPRCWWGPCCGERYWGDFYSDPPDCWDPCDGCGNYVGRNCQSCGGGGFFANGGGPVTNGGGNSRGYVRGHVSARVDDDVFSPNYGGLPTDKAVGPAPNPAAEPHKAVKPQSQ